MRAAAFDRFGAPDVVRLTELPLPTAGEGQVVVRVVAATVNPTDTLMRAGKQVAMMGGLEPPFIAGMEFAGHIHEAGRGVSGLGVGQPVMGLVNPRRPERGARPSTSCCRRRQSRRCRIRPIWWGRRRYR